jgi:N-glycosylase/DNA lyase
VSSTLSFKQKGIEPGLVLRMGQVFRFQSPSSGVLYGAEGEAWYILSKAGDDWQIESNQDLVKIERFFRLDHPPREIWQKVKQIDPRLASLPTEGVEGLTLLRPSSFIEALFGFLCSQNNTLHRIMPMTRHLGSYGPVIKETRWGALNAFPGLETLAGIQPEQLKSAGFGYRAPHIPRAANAVLEKGGEAWLDELKEIDYEEAVARLCTLPGIGRKLAECILLYGADRTESVPVDTHLWKTAAPLYLPAEFQEPLTPGRAARLSSVMRDRFGELAGWAHLLLFAASLTQGPSKSLMKENLKG